LLLVAAVIVQSCGGSSGRKSSADVPCGTKRTVQYATYPGVDPNQNSLDVYMPPAGDRGCLDRPIVVWVHGGGWAGGDKTDYMTDKVHLFNGAGYVFASVNYRLTNKEAVPPSPQYPVHNQDTADAIAWLIHHAKEIGGDAHHVAVFGHSAGGGIVAAITTDGQFLGKSGLNLDAITCAGSMDGEGYDVTAGATTAEPVEWRTVYTDAFGTDPAVWAAASPINHVSAGKGIPDYFIASRGSDWRVAQHTAFIEALQNAGVPTTVLDATELEHADLTTLVGAPGDTKVTPALMDFLGGCFK
jgi:acetyl esterase/lipase